MRRWLLLAALAGLLPAALGCGCCARNATAAECAEGSQLRARPDCKCCFACGRLQGETCNDSDRPCAEDLDCGAGGVCAEQQKCRSDGDCAANRFCLGGVCTDPCNTLDHCSGLLRDGACQVRSHRPVCTCPPGATLDAERKACVRGGCKAEDGTRVAVGEKVSRKECQETCECQPTGKFSCSKTECPPGFYRSGSFSDDPSCVELKSATVDNDCCVSVVCTDVPPASAQVAANGTDADSGTTGAATTTTEAAAATAPPTTTAPPPTTAADVSDASLAAPRDLLPLAITHNSTRLQLPAAGGRLTYRADGRPTVTVDGAADGQTRTVTGLLPGTGYLFTWSGADGVRSLRVDTRPGCVTNTSSHAIGETYHMGCQSTCVCGGPNQPACRPRCSFTRGTVTDKSCSERPDIDDPECCVQLVCAVTSTGGQIVPDATETTTEPEQTSPTTTPSPSPSAAVDEASTEPSTTSADAETTPPSSSSSAAASEAPLRDAGGLPRPTLIVTTKSHDSATLAWDDFKPPAYDGGYVAQYRRVGDEQWRRRELLPQPGKFVPLLRVDGLRPGTEYEARVSIQDGREPGALGEATETIRFTTDDACEDGEAVYAVGEKFSRGCEETCFCELSGRPRCVPRCPAPLFRAGHFRDDPLCRETPLDECCVTAVCDMAPTEDEAHQGADGMDPCEFVHCGPNSRCQMVASGGGAEPDAMDAKCVCLPGFSETTDGSLTECVADEGAPAALLNATGCEYENQTLAPGEEFFQGCEKKCVCTGDGKIECEPRCKVDQSTIENLPPGCERVPEPAPNQNCCMVLDCGNSTAAVGVPDPSFPGCIYGEEKLRPNETFYQGCKSRCTCVGFGDISCQPRCPPQQPSDDPSCSVQPDPADPCCNISICDATLAADGATTTAASPRDGTEAAEPTTTAAPAEDGIAARTRLGAGRLEAAPAALAVVGLQPVDAGASQVEVAVPAAVAERFFTTLRDEPLLVEWRYGDDAWRSRAVPHDRVLLRRGRLLAMVPGLAAPQKATVRVTYDGETSLPVSGAQLLGLDAAATPDAATEAAATAAEDPTAPTTPPPEEITDPSSAADVDAAAPTADGATCTFGGATYKVGEEFHDGCRQFCLCAETGVSCAAIECPHHFGLKLINPDCVQWSEPVDFQPAPPDCCPEITCVDDGSCSFEGETFRNLEQLPEKLTGCERRCFCEFGNVTCQSACAPVPATPPRDLPCTPDRVTLGPGANGCCRVWQCSDGVTSRPSVPPNIHSEGLGIGIGNQIEGLTVAPTSPNSAEFRFSIPPALVGLPGKVEVLYTDAPGSNDEASSWDRRVFQTTSGLLDRTDLSWQLGDLAPSTTYVMQVKVMFDQSSTILQSRIVEFTTKDDPQAGPTLPPKVEVDAELQASEVDTSSALIQWRRLTEEELRYIDGIQLRYRDVDVDAQVWTMTPFIHRELTTYKLTELKPDTTYEVDIVLMPFQTKQTEMVSSHPLRITTLPVFDRYDFNITLSKVEPGPNSVRVSWSGIPQPQYQFVNVYRIVYIYEKEREEKHTFKLAKTSDEPSMLIKGLKPSSKYQVWLEAYLKNGKKRVSEVREFDTKPGQLGKAEEIRDNSAEPGIASEPPNDYYSGMVAAAIIATIAILLCLFLAFLLVRRASRAAAQPTAPARKNGPSYENPAFKNSDLDLNGANGNERFG